MQSVGGVGLTKYRSLEKQRDGVLRSSSLWKGTQLEGMKERKESATSNPSP